MSDIVHSNYEDTEIAKADDFRFTASAPVDIITAIFDGAFDDVINSFVVSGMEIAQLASPTMNVQIAPGLAFSRAENKLLHLYSAVSALVSPAHETLDRLDTVEARYLSTNFNQETRAFKSPETGAITYNLVNTKTKVFVELKCVEGVAGSGVAPDVETGWMKLAEVEVLAGTTQIINANIHNIDAEEDGTTNSAWTAEVDASFHLGSIEEIKNTLYAHVRNNITSVNTVHGIRQGAGNGLDSDLLDGEHGSFYRNTANLDSGEYKITRSLIPGTDQYQLNILRADYDQAVVKIGPKSDWPDEDLLSYPKEATLTLYASRVRWYDLYVDISLNRLDDPDYPKLVTFMRGDGIRVPEWKVQYRKDSGAYTDLLSCDPEGDGRFYSHRGSLSCKLSEIGTLTGLSAVNSSGDYYVDGSVLGLPVDESGVIHHSQNPYSTDNAFQEYKSLVNRTNHYLRAKVSGTWSDWNKIWNSANDGTGSGLDTDLFHGLNTDSFLIDGLPTVTDATIDEATTAGIYPYVHDGATDTLLVFGTKVGGSTATVQIRYPYDNSPKWRNKTDSDTWSSWRDFIDSSVLGAGWSTKLASSANSPIGATAATGLTESGIDRYYNSNVVVVETNSTSFIKKKSFLCPIGGAVNVTFSINAEYGASAYGIIDITRGGSVIYEGAVRTTSGQVYVEFTESFYVSPGDYVEVWLRTDNASYRARNSLLKIEAQLTEYLGTFATHAG